MILIHKSNKVVRGHWLLSEHKTIKIGELGKEKREGYVLVRSGSPRHLTVAHGWLGNLSFFNIEILYWEPCDPGLHMRLKLDSLHFFLEQSLETFQMTHDFTYFSVQYRNHVFEHSNPFWWVIKLLQNRKLILEILRSQSVTSRSNFRGMAKSRRKGKQGNREEN